MNIIQYKLAIAKIKTRISNKQRFIIGYVCNACIMHSYCSTIGFVNIIVTDDDCNKVQMFYEVEQVDIKYLFGFWIITILKHSKKYSILPEIILAANPCN